MTKGRFNATKSPQPCLLWRTRAPQLCQLHRRWGLWKKMVNVRQQIMMMTVIFDICQWNLPDDAWPLSTAGILTAPSPISIYAIWSVINIIFMQLSAKDVFYSQGSLFINLVYSFLKGWGGLFLFCFVKVIVFCLCFLQTPTWKEQEWMWSWGPEP